MLIGTTPTQEAPKDTPVNGFKTAFLAIASYFGRPTSETVLFSGLPIDLSHPTFEDIERSATRIGLEVVHHSFNRAELIAANLPMMLITGKGNVIALLEEIEPNRFLVGAADSKSNQHVTTEQLISLKPVELFSFSAIYINATDRADLGAAQDVERRDWLWGTLTIFWKSYMNVALAALFINCIGLASPLFIMNVYDRILPNQALSSLWVLAIGVIVALIFDLLLKTARSAIIDHTGKVADQKLSYLLFEKVLYSQLSSRSASTGEYASRLGQYELVREFFTSSTVSVLIDSVFVFIFVGVIYLIAGWLAIIPATAFVLALIIGLISQYRIGQRVATAANEAAERNSLLVESVSTIETVKALRGEALLLRKWRN